MRQLLLKIHLYGGLLCASYLLIFAVSSLNYQHRFGHPGEEVVRWERALAVADRDGDDKALAVEIRDALGLVGYTVEWEIERDDAGNLSFDLVRPGKRYAIDARFDEKVARVVETRTGFWEVIDRLHGLMRLPGAPWLSLWGFYTELCWWVVMFSAASGLYLWWSGRRDRRMGFALLLAIAAPSLLLIAWVGLRG